ncbi:acyl-CoA dehydrogenase family member 10 [Paramormyrops kingsleyae]|uniref:acyl-CoA dehydrogenase family member 10 n=1 Tax=Paramormyrops kingsleyae TaxID=1676925 RepID=UPI003B96FB85
MIYATGLVSLGCTVVCRSRLPWHLLAGCHRRYTATPRYKAVIFDMGGVLLPSPFHKATEWEQENGIPGGTIAQAIKTGGENNSWRKFMRGEMDAQLFVEAFSKECADLAGRPVSAASFVSALTSGPMAQTHPAMMEAIQCIRAEGLRTAVLSNNFFLSDGNSYLPLDRSLFDVIVESCLEAVCKPDPRIYHLCLERLGVLPQEAVFLDDIGSNAKAAAQLGLHAIKVMGPDSAIKELSAVLGFPLAGFVRGTRNVRKTMQLPMDQLTHYLQEVLHLPSTEPVTLRQFCHGQSNPTYLVTCGGQRVVLRKKPPGKLLPSAHAVEREFRVLKALGHAGVPVPEVIALCEDASVLGTPFYLMQYCPGRVFQDPSLPGLSPQERGEVYQAMTRVLCQIHSVDIEAAGLSDFGKPGEYVARQVHRWTKQYRASETRRIPAMERLMEWFPQHLPRLQRNAVVHGDFRLDNLVFDAEKPEVVSVLDWELSTLGDPLADLASSCMAHYLPPDFPVLRGISQCDLAEMGIPPAEEIFSQYARAMGLGSIDDWQLYMAFSFFRVAAILQGVYQRSLKGQASSASAGSVGQLAEQMADLAWDFATKEGFHIFNALPRGPQPGDGPSSQRRSFCTRVGSPQATPPHMSSAPRDPSRPQHCSGAAGLLVVSPEGLPPRVQELHRHLWQFVNERILPMEQHLRDHQLSPDGWSPHPLIEELKGLAKAQGLWNLFIPVEMDPEGHYGAGLTNMEYAYLAEIMGHSVYAPEVFNCSAPDTGNMEVLIRYGTQQQQEQWLHPLLDGTIRSCFAMTEPNVASSDATNIQASITEDKDSYILNGRKWWTSGALDPRCKLCIFMGKTDPSAARHRQQSMVLVPMDTPGVTVLRPLSVYGMQDPPGGHAELQFDNVRVPRSNILLGPGRGFEIAQGRLGPGRIHHCMRLVGHAERALALMKERVRTRVAFGRPLVEQGTILASIAQSRLEIEQARLLVLKAALLMDTVGNKVAAPEIAMIKAVCPSMALKVIDRAIQAFGAAGLSNDHPLALLYSWARALRLADGPDEVHQASVAKMELKRQY